jgi:hypothetical protein
MLSYLIQKAKAFFSSSVNMYKKSLLYFFIQFYYTSQAVAFTTKTATKGDDEHNINYDGVRLG